MSSNTIPRSVGNPRVSLTGYATASAWAHYGFEQAEWFDTWRGRLLFNPMHAACRAVRPVLPVVGGFTDSLYWRHRWFGAWAARQNPSLAIEIGAGLSSRGIVYARDHPTMQWADYDLPDMVAARRTMLAGRPLPHNYSLEAGDLLGGALAPDLEAPRTGHSIVLTEGVVDYLDMTEKKRAWQSIAALLERLGGGRYLCEVHPAHRVHSFGSLGPVMIAALRRITGRDITAHLFDEADTAIDLLCECGFEKAWVVPDAGLPGATRAPPPDARAYTLVAAQI